MSTAEQTREQWLAERRQRLGASDVPAVLGLDEYRGPYEVWLEKTGRLEPWDGNEATRLGNVLEPSILDYAEQELGPLNRHVVYHAEGLPIASTLDSEVAETREPVECKTAGMTNAFSDLSAWGEPGTDEVPENYLVQVQTQLLCSREELAYLFALIRGRGIVRYEIERSDKAIETIGNYCADWWERHVVQGHEPERAGLTLDVVKRMRRQPGKTVELDDEIAALIDQRDAMNKQKRDLERAAKDIQATIIAALGDAEAGTLTDGRTVEYAERQRKGYTVEPTTYRQLTIKKAKK